MKRLNPVLIISGIVLLIINFLVIFQYELLESRWLRIISSFFYLILFLKVSKKNEIFLIGSFFLLVISDFLMLDYENPLLKKLTFILVIIAYIALIFHIRPHIKNLQTNFFQKILFVIILAVNTVMLFLLVDMVEGGMDDSIHQALFFLYGFAMISLVIFAFSFNHRYSNKASFFFICAVLGFIFSDISGFISYYLKVDEFYYPDRFFYLLGLLSLVKFANIDKSEGLQYSEDML